MKTLVTGGAGFIGSHLVDKLLEEGHEVAVIDDLSTGKRENLSKKAEFFKAKVEGDKIKDIIRRKRPEAVFHLAAQISVRDSVQNPVADARTNIIGTINLLEAARKNDVKKIVFTSSAAVYGQPDRFPTPEESETSPLSPYGVAKLTGEKYLAYYFEVFRLEFTVLRLANVYGPRQSLGGEAGVVAIFTNQMLKDRQPVIYGDGEQTRDFVYVKDVARAALKAADSSKTGVFNVSRAREVSINRIFKEINDLTGAKMKVKREEVKEGDPRRSCLDNAKIKRELGWQPRYGLKEGLKETVSWFENKI